MSSLGPSGTIVFVDTSRLLHFGSRVSSRDRYVVMVQYLALTNFMHNPFYSFEAWPYAHLAQPHFTPAQRATSRRRSRHDTSQSIAGAGDAS